MANRTTGRKQAVAKIRRKYGRGFYKRIGKLAGGGKHIIQGGFASQKVGADGLTGPQRAKQASKLSAEVRRRVEV